MGQEEAGSSYKGYSFGAETSAILRAAVAVHRELGPGFLERTYQLALEVEFQHMGIAAQREVDVPIFYRDVQIETRRADFVVQGIVVELKAVEQLVPEHVAQLAMYLKAARKTVGLVINFGAARLQTKRVVN